MLPNGRREREAEAEVEMEGKDGGTGSMKPGQRRREERRKRREGRQLRFPFFSLNLFYSRKKNT